MMTVLLRLVADGNAKMCRELQVPLAQSTSQHPPFDQNNDKV